MTAGFFMSDIWLFRGFYIYLSFCEIVIVYCKDYETYKLAGVVCCCMCNAVFM